MSILKKILAVLGAALTLILPTLTPMVEAIDVPSTVEIEALTCGLEFGASSANTLDYGLIAPDEISTASGQISVTNTGNTLGEVFISGTDWKDGPGSTQMLVGVTHYGDSANYDNINILSSTPAVLTNLPPGSTLSAQTFMVKGVLENPGFSGPLTQTVSISEEC